MRNLCIIAVFLLLLCSCNNTPKGSWVLFDDTDSTYVYVNGSKGVVNIKIGDDILWTKMDVDVVLKGNNEYYVTNPLNGETIFTFTYSGNNNDIVTSITDKTGKPYVMKYVNAKVSDVGYPLPRSVVRAFNEMYR